MPDQPGVDFAVLASCEEGSWQVTAIPTVAAEELSSLLHLSRSQATGEGAIALVSYDDDYFVVVRVVGSTVRLLLSDVTAAEESLLAREVLDALDLPLPEGDDRDRVQPAGDLGLLDDLGLSAMDLGALCSELDLYPEEMLAEVAGKLGFADAFDQAVDAAGA